MQVVASRKAQCLFHVATQKFVTPPSVIVWRIYEAKEGAEKVALHNDEHHNLCTSPVIGTNIN